MDGERAERNGHPLSSPSQLNQNHPQLLYTDSPVAMPEHITETLVGHPIHKEEKNPKANRPHKLKNI